MNTTPDIEAAAATVMPDVESIIVEPLPGGSSAFVASLGLRRGDGPARRVVFRQHNDRSGKDHSTAVAAKEFRLTEALAAQELEVARPLALHGPQTVAGPWLVTEWIDGTTAVEPEALDLALDQMADFLARLHAVDLPASMMPALDEIEDPIDELPRFLPERSPDPTVETLFARLGRPIARRPNASVVLHGDFWPGNVMFRDRQLVAVLDWEDAAVGDPLVDLACARVELACAYGDNAAADFTDRYLARQVRPFDVHDLPLWETYVCATALSSMHRWGLSADDERIRRTTTTRRLAAAVDELVANDA